MNSRRFRRVVAKVTLRVLCNSRDTRNIDDTCRKPFLRFGTLLQKREERKCGEIDCSDIGSVRIVPLRKFGPCEQIILYPLRMRFLGFGRRSRYTGIVDKKVDMFLRL
jgi:hypothetical protein